MQDVPASRVEGAMESFCYELHRDEIYGPIGVKADLVCNGHLSVESTSNGTKLIKYAQEKYEKRIGTEYQENGMQKFEAIVTAYKEHGSDDVVWYLKVLEKYEKGEVLVAVQVGSKKRKLEQ